jgi:glucuronokinase
VPPRAVEAHASARAGLLGNPSDGYFGRTLSLALPEFSATVRLVESPTLKVEAGPDESNVFPSLEALAAAVGSQGYYGATRLVKATLKTFYDYCREAGIGLPETACSVTYRSSIPRQVGLGGSSAIVTAALRALMSFYNVEIPKERQPDLILSAERDELGITAGLQDRVVQVYEGLVFMDFSRSIMEELGHGAYEPLDPSLLPRLFVAYGPAPAKVSGGVLDQIRIRWEAEDPEVQETLAQIGELAVTGRSALLQGDHLVFSSLMDRNFDLRRSIMPIAQADLAMVEAARDLGASAKLTGSGGAITGVVDDDTMFGKLVQRLGRLGARVTEAIPR